MKELSQLDRSALELLASSRRSVEQEISGRANTLHNEALAADKTLTLIGHLGQEAVGLYHDFARRDEYFRGSGRRGVRRYARYIRGMHEDWSEERARDTALTEINRRDREKSQNELARRFGFSGTGRIKSGHIFVSPPIYKVDAELLDSYQVSQQWRATSNVPFDEGLQIQILHQYVHERGIKRATTVYDILLPKEDGTDCVVSDGEHEVIESDLLLPIGLLQAARRAVQESVPHRVAKKW